jgi:Tfp pilus assembly PilM family ATPase
MEGGNGNDLFQRHEVSERGFGVARLNNITSTEKLLKIIRSRKDEPFTEPAAATESQSHPTGRFRIPLPRLINLHAFSTVGIDIGHDYLRVVRIEETGGGKWEIVDRRRFAVPPKTPRDTPEFTAFLKSSLASIGGSAKQSDLWVNMSAARVDVHHIRIPKVSRKQLSNVVYYTAKKETPFDEREMIFDFEAQGEVIEQGIPKLGVMVYTAPRQEIEDLKKIFSRIGRPLTGISIVPFSVQNFFRTSWISAVEGTVASLFIAGDNLVMTRGIKAGLSSMVESLVERFNEERPSPDIPELTIEQGRKIVRSLSPDSPRLQATDVGANLSEEAIFQMIEPALERLVRQVERTFEHFATTMPGERIFRIFVSGAMNVYRPIVEYVGSQLGISSAVLDPLSEQDVAVCPDVDDIACVSERIAFGPALGLALSDNDRTPNLMFTYKDKEREASVIRINRTVFAAFMASVLIFAGIFTFQNIEIAQKREALSGIEREIAGFGAPVDQDQIMKMAAGIGKRRQLSKVYANRYLDTVLIGELAALTPPGIRLTDVKISFGPPPSMSREKSTDAAAPKPNLEEVTVEGLIIGDRQMLETSLAGFTIALESSPIFRQVTLQKNSVEPYLKNDALHFILTMKVEEQVHG